MIKNKLRRRIFSLIGIVVILLSISAYAYRDKNSEALLAFSTEKNKDDKSSHSVHNKKIEVTYKEDNVISFSEVLLYYNNKKLDFKSNILQKYNRYYLPLTEVCEQLNGTLDKKHKKIDISFKDYKVTINLVKGNYDIDKFDEKMLRVEPINKDGEVYLSLFDITEIFNLKPHWNYAKNEILLYDGDSRIHKENKLLNKTKSAFIRLEDVAAGTIYTKNENLEKMRAVADYLDGEDVAYHVAWIPRYVNPKEGIDNDLSKINSIENNEFVFTLDYMINRNGLIGLHGYTHQYGNEESIISEEFSKESFTDEKSIRDRIESAIIISKKLDIPYEFFESPHYTSTKFQQSVIEQYFDYIYEPCVGIWNAMPVISPRNRRTHYIPAPLSYVKDRNVDEMIDRIKSNKDKLTSFFYHPSKEFDDIKVNYDKDGRPTYEYSSSSMLHKLVNTLKAEGYKVEKITDKK